MLQGPATSQFPTNNEYSYERKQLLKNSKMSGLINIIKMAQKKCHFLFIWFNRTLEENNTPNEVREQQTRTSSFALNHFV